MQVKKSLVAAMAVVALGAGALGTGAVFAAENGSRPMDSLVSAIATKFNLDTAEVQAVFDAHRETQETERLAKAVEDGQLTQAQADAMAARREEDQAFFASLEEMTDEERKEALEGHREEMEAWAEANDLPAPMFHMHHGRRPGGPGMHGFQDRAE